MRRTHPFFFCVDLGYRGIGGRTGKWGNSFWEKTLRICTTMTLLGWEAVLDKPIPLEASAASIHWASQAPFCSAEAPFLFTIPSSFSSPSSTLSYPFLLQRSEIVGFEASRITGMEENITLWSFIWSTQQHFLCLPQSDIFRGTQPIQHCALGLICKKVIIPLLGLLQWEHCLSPAIWAVDYSEEGFFLNTMSMSIWTGSSASACSAGLFDSLLWRLYYYACCLGPKDSGNVWSFSPGTWWFSLTASSACHFPPDVKLRLTCVSSSSFHTPPLCELRDGGSRRGSLSSLSALIYSTVSLCGFCTNSIKYTHTFYFGNIMKDSSLL